MTGNDQVIRSIHFESRASLSSSTRLLAAGALVAVGLVMGVVKAGAQEAPTDTPTPASTASATVSPTDTPVVTTTSVPTTTPVPSETATPTPVDPRIAKLGAAMDELQADLADDLSDTTKAQIDDVRLKLTALVAFQSTLGGARVQSDPSTAAQLDQLVHDLRSSLNELRHDVQDDSHGMAKGGGGQLIRDVRHDVNFLKKDLDADVRDAREAIENGTATPVATVAASTTPAPSPSVTPLPGATVQNASVPREDKPGKSEGHKPEGPKTEAPKSPKPSEPSKGNGKGGGKK